MGAEFIVSNLAGLCVESSEWSKRKNLGIKVVIRFDGSKVVFRSIYILICETNIILLWESSKVLCNLLFGY